jgi:hypothetical protein
MWKWVGGRGDSSKTHIKCNVWSRAPIEYPPPAGIISPLNTLLTWVDDTFGKILTDVSKSKFLYPTNILSMFLQEHYNPYILKKLKVSVIRDVTSRAVKIAFIYCLRWKRTCREAACPMRNQRPP